MTIEGRKLFGAIRRWKKLLQLPLRRFSNEERDTIGLHGILSVELSDIDWYLQHCLQYAFYRKREQWG